MFFLSFVKYIISNSIIACQKIHLQELRTRHRLDWWRQTAPKRKSLPREETARAVVVDALLGWS